MELNMRDVDFFVNGLLKNYDSKYRLAIYVILMQCINEVGLKKSYIIENIEQYVNEEKLKSLSNMSFSNKTYLKNFISTEEYKRVEIINDIIKLIEKCKEENGLLIIQEQPKLISKNNTSREEKNKVIEVKDAEIGDLKIDIDDGIIYGEKLKYHSQGNYNNFPIRFDLNEIKVSDIKDINLVDDFQAYRDIYLYDIKKILKKIKEIEQFTIDTIWKWFTADYTEQEIKEKFTNMSISLFVELYSEEKEDYFITAGWSFEEEADEVEGYLDFSINRDNGKLEKGNIGYY